MTALGVRLGSGHSCLAIFSFLLLILLYKNLQRQYKIAIDIIPVLIGGKEREEMLQTEAPFIKQASVGNFSVDLSVPANRSRLSFNVPTF